MPEPVIESTETPAAGATPEAKPNGQQPAGKKRGPEIRIPQAAFKARVQREAAVEVKRRLGVSIEEAEALVKAKASGSEAATGAGVADEVVAKLKREMAAATARASKAEADNAALTMKHKKDIQRLKDKATESELVALAKSAGVVDADYAIHLFAKAAASGTSTDPVSFFAGLKTTRAALFVAPVEAAKPVPPEKPVTVSAGTAPPESGKPGEEKPKPKDIGPGVAVDGKVDDMNPQEFASHMRGKYGYQAGMG